MLPQSLCLLTALTTLTAAAQDYAIHAGTLIDGTGAPAQHERYIAVSYGRIAGITSHRPPKLPVKEFTGDTAIPGLIDAHGHIAAIGLGEGADERLLNESNQERWALCNAREAVAGGVTTLRDAGTYLWTLALRPRIEAAGLRWIAAGRQLVKKCPDAYMCPMFVEYDGAVDARVQVRARKAEGSDFIKLRLTSLRPLPSLEEARAIVEESHKLHMRVAVHTDPQSYDAVRLALAAGADTIEHNGPLRIPDPDQVFPEIVRRGIVVVPGIGNWVTRFEPLTMEDKQIPDEPLRSRMPSVLVEQMQAHAAELRAQATQMMKSGFNPQKRREELRAETLRAFNAGVLLAAGPDTGVDLMPHGRLFKDIEWFLEAGIPVEKAVQMATLNGARAAGIENEAGSLESGKVADIVVLRGDTAKQPDFRRVLLVIRSGRIVFDASAPWAPCEIR